MARLVPLVEPSSLIILIFVYITRPSSEIYTISFCRLSSDTRTHSSLLHMYIEYLPDELDSSYVTVTKYFPLSLATLKIFLPESICSGHCAV